MSPLFGSSGSLCFMLVSFLGYLHLYLSLCIAHIVAVSSALKKTMTKLHIPLYGAKQKRTTSALTVLQTKSDICANSVDLGEMACNEPSH